MSTNGVAALCVTQTSARKLTPVLPPTSVMMTLRRLRWRPSHEAEFHGKALEFFLGCC